MSIWENEETKIIELWEGYLDLPIGERMEVTCLDGTKQWYHKVGNN